MNPLKRLTEPRWPASAVGLSGGSAAVVSLEQRRDAFTVRRAAHVALPAGLIEPGFDTPNISNPQELGEILRELATSAGLNRKQRWSAALPEATMRTMVLTLESAPASRGEAEEMLRWKMERGFGVPLAEMRVGRERLRPDAGGRARYLITGIRLEALAAYEEVFASLGWHVGLILPRHMGEAWWLRRDGARVDSLLVSSHAEGFTAVLLRDGQPLIVRNAACDDEKDRTDELYRFLLFYRDRIATPPEGNQPLEAVERLLVLGSGLSQEQASEIIEETLAARPRALDAADVRLVLPSPDLDFNAIAAPAGLAALAYS